MATLTRDRRRADRIRAAICVTLAAADHHTMTIPELVAALSSRGLDLGANPNKTISDAVRWEIARGHVRKTGRGKFAVGRIPRSTLHYMRVRVNGYVADPSRDYSRPHNPTIVRAEPEPSRLLELLDASNRARGVGGSNE